jgi:transcriptional regulator with XRE-family HTH domain
VQTVAGLFGASLRRVRREKGLSQERLAELTGLSTNFVGEMERGLKAPGLTVVVRLARALGTSVHDLLADFTDANARKLRLT